MEYIERVCLHGNCLDCDTKHFESLLTSQYNQDFWRKKNSVITLFLLTHYSATRLCYFLVHFTVLKTVDERVIVTQELCDKIIFLRIIYVRIKSREAKCGELIDALKFISQPLSRHGSIFTKAFETKNVSISARK